VENGVSGVARSVDARGGGSSSGTSGTSSMSGISPLINWGTLERVYPHYPTIDELHVAPTEQELWIDLAPYIDKSAHRIHEDSSVPRAYRLFRTLGLRHLSVVTQYNQCVGIITRADLVRVYHQGEHDAFFDAGDITEIGASISAAARPHTSSGSGSGAASSLSSMPVTSGLHLHDDGSGAGHASNSALVGAGGEGGVGSGGEYEMVRQRSPVNTTTTAATCGSGDSSHDDVSSGSGRGSGRGIFDGPGPSLSFRRLSQQVQHTVALQQPPQ
jgi:hypothetical protein